MKCIVCKKELNRENPGAIVGSVVGWCSDPKIRDYNPPKQMAFHTTCEREAMKISYQEDTKRFKKMGVILG